MPKVAKERLTIDEAPRSYDKKPLGINGVDNMGRPTVLTPVGITYVLAKSGNWVDSRRMQSKGNRGAFNSGKFADPRKVHPSKLTNYIRRVHIDGVARLLAYEETIDPNIREVSTASRYSYINRLESREDYEPLKTFILEESEKDMVMRSMTIKNKVFDTLMATLESAHKGVLENPGDPKVLAAASSVIKSFTPILAAREEEDKAKEAERIDSTDRLRLRAQKVVN